MGKKDKAKRARAAAIKEFGYNSSSPPPSPPSSPSPDPKRLKPTPSSSSSSSSSSIPPSVLHYLTNLPPSTLLTPPLKPLRAALHPLLATLLERYNLPNYIDLTTTSLTSKSWPAARLNLQALITFLPMSLDSPTTLVLKQGTVQRWVRALDFCTVSTVKLELLNMVVKAQNIVSGEGGGNKHDAARAAAAALLESEGGGTGEGEEEGRDGGRDEIRLVSPTTEQVEISEREEKKYPPMPPSPCTSKSDLQLVYSEKPSDRRPPNHYQLRTWKSPAPPSPLFAPCPSVTITKHTIPSVPGAFLLLNVLSPAECKYMIDTCEKMEYTPDHPVHAEKSTGIDSTEWLVTPEVRQGVDSVEALEKTEDGILKGIEARVLQHMDAVPSHGSPVGINPRWRAFRYGSGGLYRPHIDGSWTCAGEDKDGKYTNDVRGDRRSKYTFLMYLNDDFDGGTTTYYMSGESGLKKLGVKPVRGGVLVFPQGNIASLVHEGSEVEGNGVKYVIRTDVVYADK